jgi:adenosylcobinamide-GDP ribazoletransferase
MSGEPASVDPAASQRRLAVLGAGLLLSLTTLTVLPLPARAVNRRTGGAAMGWAPAVGLGLGGVLSAAAWGLTELGVDPLPAAAVLVVLLALLSRGLHLDGLADTFDALGSYRDRDGALAIMKSPEVGPLGVAAIAAVLLVDAAALSALVARQAWWSIAVGVGIGRLAITLCCARRIPAARPDGLGALVAGTVAPVLCLAWVVLLVVVQAVDRSAGWVRPILAVLLACLLVALLARHAVRRFGGITGDVLGAACELASALALVVLS